MKMKNAQEALLAYIATLITILVLALAGAAAVLFAPNGSPEMLARIIGALGFISAGMTGLVGVIGTFRPKSSNENKPVEGDG